MEREIRDAEERAKAIIGDSDDNVFHFGGYGADWIKAQGQPRHISLHRSQNTILTKSPIHSPTFPRCIHPDGTPTSLVPNKRELHRDV
jgi:hypothetical protein